jgi:hypothetical protein
MKLSRAQKFIRFFTSKAMFEKMRIDSEKWKFTCKSCNATSSIWEIGGIRYKAVGDR